MKLQEVLCYDAALGEFSWAVTLSNRAKVGTRAGTPSGAYRQIRINGKLTLEHRLVWQYVHGYIPDDVEIDHINGDGHDNRLDNLRLATRSENAQNKRHAQSTSKTGVQGVKFDKRRGVYIARIKCNGVETYLGQYTTVESAHQAYITAKRVMHSHNTL